MNRAPLKTKLMRRAWARNDAKRDAGLVEPDNIVKNKDISYGPHDVYNLLDVYRPDGENKYPLIVNVHGGGYFYGSKDLYRFYCMQFATRGFAVVNFNYRVSPEYRFPAALEDINEVMCWIEAHSEDYNFDLDKVIVIGDSAGAQLGSQYAAINTNQEYAKLFGFKKHGVKIRVLGLACGMYDPIKFLTAKKKNPLMVDYLGKDNLNPDNEKLRVLDYITSEYPSTFVFSAVNDFLRDECEPMYKFLKNKGVYTEYKIFGTADDKKIGHVFHEDLNLPEGKKANDMQVDFFRRMI